jgi:alpha-tubulin suppressor-like RCC1 family protein
MGSTETAMRAYVVRACVTTAVIAVLALVWSGPAKGQPGPACVLSGIVAGGDHTCAYTLGATAMCWGDNQFGQAGIGNFSTPVTMPTPVVSFEPDAMTVAGNPYVHSFVAGQRHTCAISNPVEFIPVCWGDNRLGQLAADQIPGNIDTCPLGTAMCSAYRTPVHASDGVAHFTVASALAAGNQHSCMVWGQKVLCWGDNSLGQLGDGQIRAGGPFDHVSDVPVLAPPADPPALDIAAGGFHTCSRMDDNTARCWGDNRFGQVGNGNASTQPVTGPSVVQASDGGPLDGVMLMAAGERHTCALRSDSGFVWCWGDNSAGQIGRDPATTPSAVAASMVSDPVNGLTLIGVEIAAGMFHTCLLKTDGTVQCWGGNAKGQLGPSVLLGANSFKPMTVVDANGNPLSGVSHIAAGSNHTCAVLSAGGVMCWGDNSLSQLGVSTAPATMSAVPVAVGGVCTCSGLTACNGQCVDTTADPANCGGCNNLCFAGEQCMASMCRCAGTLCAAPGPTQICTNLMSDPKNCLQCGHICPRGAVCSSNGCVCPAGLTECRGGCVDLQFDNNNCGRCGVRCRATPPCNREESGCTTCENGECVPF